MPSEPWTCRGTQGLVTLVPTPTTGAVLVPAALEFCLPPVNGVRHPHHMAHFYLHGGPLPSTGSSGGSDGAGCFPSGRLQQAVGLTTPSKAIVPYEPDNAKEMLASDQRALLPERSAWRPLKKPVRFASDGLESINRLNDGLGTEAGFVCRVKSTVREVNELVLSLHRAPPAFR